MITETVEQHLARIEAKMKANPIVAVTDNRAANLKTAELRQKWNAPARQAEFTPTESGEWGEALEDCRRLVLGSSGMVAITGERGTGKTQIAVEIMKQWTAVGKSALFTNALDFFIEIKGCYRKDGASERDVINSFRKPALLVIDEIGKRGETDWENNMLFLLLNHRYNDMKATILIDNNSAADFTRSIGPSIASRMQECGGIIECNWKSFRA